MGVRRYYFRNTALPPATPATSASWSISAEVQRVAMTQTAFDEGVNQISYHMVSKAGFPGLQTVLIDQYVADDTLPAGSVEGVFTIAQGTTSPSFPTDMVYRVVIRVVSGDGATVRGTCYSGPGLPVSADPLADNAQASGAHAWIREAPLSAVEAQAGDRLVVEVGYESGYQYDWSNWTLYRGAPTGATDLSVTEREVDQQGIKRGFIEFTLVDPAPPGPPIRHGGSSLERLYVGADPVEAIYLGETLLWEAQEGVTPPPVSDEPKIDLTHMLANRQTLLHLASGDLTGMTEVSGTAQTVDSAYASATAGTLVMHRSAMPAPNDRSFRISALIKVDKTSGRYSRIGFASNTATPTTASPDIYIGHDAGSGIRVNSVNFTISLLHTVLSEEQCVDGAWYRVTLVYENGVLDQNDTDTNTGRARVQGTAEPVDMANAPAEPWYPATASSRHDAVAPTAYVPMAVVARTNSALGTIRDLYYIDSMLGATSNGTVNGGDPVDNAPITMVSKAGDGSSGSDSSYIYSKGKAAPLRVIVTAGGSGTYGGLGGFGHASGRTGHPYDAFRKFWRDLADLGYTVLHTDALHEGWGADDHLVKQLEALGRLQSEFGVDVRLYYLGYSMGGASLWRAIRGRAGFPQIRAAYSVAGISRIGHYWDIGGLYGQSRTRWPVRENIDEPQSWPAADLISRGTRVRMVTSTGDASVSKVDEHDPMKAKYLSTPEGTALFTELVHEGIGHFDPAYWDAQDCVDFFEGVDLD